MEINSLTQIQFDVKIDYENIVKDVDFTSWKVARCRIQDNSMAEDEASTDDDSKYFIRKRVSEAIDNLKSGLGACVYDEDGDEDDLVLHFVESNESWKGKEKSLSRYIHQYIVNYVLASWFVAVMPGEASAYMELADKFYNSSVGEANKSFVRNVFFNI